MGMVGIGSLEVQDWEQGAEAVAAATPLDEALQRLGKALAGLDQQAAVTVERLMAVRNVQESEPESPRSDVDATPPRSAVVAIVHDHAMHAERITRRLVQLGHELEV